MGIAYLVVRRSLSPKMFLPAHIYGILSLTPDHGGQDGILLRWADPVMHRYRGYLFTRPRRCRGGPIVFDHHCDLLSIQQ